MKLDTDVNRRKNGNYLMVMIVGTVVILSLLLLATSNYDMIKSGVMLKMSSHPNDIIITYGDLTEKKKRELFTDFKAKYNKTVK